MSRYNEPGDAQVPGARSVTMITSGFATHRTPPTPVPGTDKKGLAWRHVGDTCPDQRVRLAKRTSNLFRTRSAIRAPGLDVTGLTNVLSIDTEGLTADVEGMCTYEDLVAATLPFGLAPLVVPQLKTITVGGAATGLGIESTAFRSGLTQDDIVEMDLLTGSGELLTVTPDGEHADLFYGFPNS